MTRMNTLAGEPAGLADVADWTNRINNKIHDTAAGIVDLVVF